MALPILETPKYETKLPSTGKKLVYRPYLVKEEKILMMAIESEDQKQIMQAMKDTVSSCTFGKIDPDSLPIFDLEYIFLKLRSKSVGEVAKIGIKCTSCEKSTVNEINLDEITVNTENTPSNKIKLSDKVGVIMRWPDVNFITGMTGKSKVEQKAAAYDVLVHCIESIFDDKKVYPTSEQSQEEVVTFIESLNQVQFQKIQEFIEAMPKLEHEVSFTCKHCQHENKVMLRGLQNFF
jgi:hypothetical protein